MLLHNVEFHFKATRGQDYKRYTHGRKVAQAAINALDPDDEAYVIKLCEIMDDFFADILGEDYADRLNLDTEDVDPLLQLLSELNDAATPPSLRAVAASLPEMPEPAAKSVSNTVPMSRAARRAARKAAKRHA